MPTLRDFDDSFSFRNSRRKSCVRKPRSCKPHGPRRLPFAQWTRRRTPLVNRHLVLALTVTLGLTPTLKARHRKRRPIKLVMPILLPITKESNRKRRNGSLLIANKIRPRRSDDQRCCFVSLFKERLTPFASHYSESL